MHLINKVTYLKLGSKLDLYIIYILHYTLNTNMNWFASHTYRIPMVYVKFSTNKLKLARQPLNFYARKLYLRNNCFYYTKNMIQLFFIAVDFPRLSFTKSNYLSKFTVPHSHDVFLIGLQLIRLELQHRSQCSFQQLLNFLSTDIDCMPPN